MRVGGPRILLVGAGKMGGALLAGWLDRGIAADRIAVVDPGPPPEVERLMAERGVRRGAEGPCDVLVLAVKPQSMAGVLPRVARHMDEGTLAISVAAGTTIEAIDSGLGGNRAVVRTIPNTPAAVGRGMTVACANPRVTAEQRAAADALLQAVGRVAWVDDEDLIDAVTAVSGSGPAYVFLLAEAMAQAGAKAGLPRDLADLIARETVVGAGALMAASDLPSSKLRENVTSPAGTTAAALSVLMGEGGFAPLLERAVEAAARRSRELRG